MDSGMDYCWLLEICEDHGGGGEVQVLQVCVLVCGAQCGVCFFPSDFFWFGYGEFDMES